MFLWTFITVVENEWLSKEELDPVIRAWNYIPECSTSIIAYLFVSIVYVVVHGVIYVVIYVVILHLV